MTKATQWFPWNGSKRWLLPRLTDTFREWGGSGRFIDPFCGGGSVSRLIRQLFPATPHVLADANPWLMSAFEWQASGQVYVLPENFGEVAYWRSLRDGDLPCLDLHARATRFAICLLTAWGNRWKTEVDGSFTASSTPVNARYCEASFLRRRLEAFFTVNWLRLGDVTMSQDWKKSVADVRPGDLVYLDTPYPELLGYGNQGWGFSDQLDVIDWVAEHPEIAVVVSNMATLDRLYRRAGLRVELVTGPAPSRTKKQRVECLAWRLPVG